MIPAVVLLTSALLPLPNGAHIANIPSICTFHNLTGLPCPGCGLTRSFVCCAHGRWVEAFVYHPAGPLFFAATIAWLLFSFKPRAALVLQPIQRQLIIGTVSMLLSIWVVRLAGWFPPPP